MIQTIARDHPQSCLRANVCAGNKTIQGYADIIENFSHQAASRSFARNAGHVIRPCTSSEGIMERIRVGTEVITQAILPFVSVQAKLPGGAPV